MNKEN